MTHGLDTSFLVAMEITGHPQYIAAHTRLLPLRQQGDRFALAPQVLAEFVHVVTDPRRFPTPLDMPAALQRTQQLWLAPEVERLYPTASAIDLFPDLDGTVSTRKKAAARHAVSGDLLHSRHHFYPDVEPRGFRDVWLLPGTHSVSDRFVIPLGPPHSPRYAIPMSPIPRHRRASSASTLVSRSPATPSSKRATVRHSSSRPASFAPQRAEPQPTSLLVCTSCTMV